MPIPALHKASFESERFYHIICKSLPNEKLFRIDENKIYFFDKLNKYVCPFFKILSYCMLDNHVHLLTQLKVADILNVIELQPEELKTGTQKKFLCATKPEELLDDLIEKQFNSFFVSYTRSYNILYKRKGHLFIRPFRRMPVNTDEYLTQINNLYSR